jgi:photosystem II stability/assembly factor-like uncharacterized protein
LTRYKTTARIAPDQSDYRTIVVYYSLRKTKNVHHQKLPKNTQSISLVADVSLHMKTIFKLAICITFLSGCANDPTPQKDANWKKVDLKTSTNLQKVFFVNSSVGFVGGTQRAQLSTTVNQYIDGDGYSAYVESVHINTDSSKYFYKTVSASNPEPTLFITRDGGDSWTSLATPFISSITDIFFLDELAGYVATEYEGIHRTTDGGKTWKSVISNIGFLGNQRIVENPFNKVYFLNKLEGFAFKQYNNIVVKTIDGGASWTVVSSFDLKYVNGGGLKSMTFPFDNFTGYGVGGFHLLKTVNGGLTWDTLHYKLPAFQDIVYNIQDLSFVDENIAFMIYGGIPYISKDGAVNWERIDFRPLSGDRIQPINENEFYILSHGNPLLAYANVSNREYVPITTSHGETQINDWFFTDDKGFAVGPNGLLLKYERN